MKKCIFADQTNPRVHTLLKTDCCLWTHRKGGVDEYKKHPHSNSIHWVRDLNINSHLRGIRVWNYKAEMFVCWGFFLLLFLGTVFLALYWKQRLPTLPSQERDIKSSTERRSLFTLNFPTATVHSAVVGCSIPPLVLICHKDGMTDKHNLSSVFLNDQQKKKKTHTFWPAGTNSH